MKVRSKKISVKLLIFAIVSVCIATLVIQQFVKNIPHYAKPVGVLREEKNDRLQQNITSYMEAHKSQYARGKDDYHCSTTLYGYDNKYAYAWVNCSGYLENANHQREQGSGFGMPIRFEFASPDYKILSYKQPSDGSQYAQTIRQLFPEKFYKRAMGNAVE